MKQRKRPEWMTKPLKDESIDEILMTFVGDPVKDPTDLTIRRLYEYIRELEGKDASEQNQR